MHSTTGWKHLFAFCFYIWMSPYDVQDFGPEGVALFRPTIIQEVLATDMKKHFEILSRFQVCAS